MHFRMASITALLVALIAMNTTPASAARLLFVSDGFTDVNIPIVLRNAGHEVVTVVNDFDPRLLDNPTLRGDLDSYDAVYWSATAERHLSPDVFTNLSAFVRAGGRVFVTGFDSVAAPTNSLLIEFLGASGAIDAGSSLGPILDTPTSLSAGVIDVRGLIPTGHAVDRDMLIGLHPDTLDVAPGSAPGLPEGSSWTLRSLGWGEIAYVSNGDTSEDHASWEPNPDGSPNAYHAALLNFAFAGDTLITEPGAPIFSIEGPRVISEGQALALRITIDDPTDCEVSWDLDGDGIFSERLGELHYQIGPGVTDGPSIRRIAAQVRRREKQSQLIRVVRIVNEPPRLGINPPRLFFANRPYAGPLPSYDPAGDRDPIGFTFLNGPAGADVDETGILRWTPSYAQSQAAIGELRFTVELTDDDGASSTASWEVNVADHQPPNSPDLVFPLPGRGFDEHPRFIVNGGMDPESQPITYQIEVSQDGSFRDPQMQASGPLTPQPGYTTWQPDLPKQAGTWHWRAWTHDGEFSSARIASTYRLLGDQTPALPPLTPPQDAAMPSTPTPGPQSGCVAHGPFQTRGPEASLFLLIALLVIRRQRS